MKVLLVDDDAFVVNGLKSMIGWERYGIDEIATAYDGEDAWQQFQRGKPDLLITDVYMPRMNGLELIKQIRTVDAELPVVILSGYGEFDYAKEAIHLDVAQYILKPAVFTEIENILNDVLSEKALADRKKQYFNGLLQQLEQSVPILREQFLFDMITIGMKRKDAADSKIQFLQLEENVFHGGLVMSLLLHRERKRKTELEKDWQLYKFAVYNVAQEIVAKAGQGYVLRYMEDRLSIVMFGEREETLSRAQRVAEELIGSIGTYLELNANVGIGHWYGEMSSYPLSCKESRELLMMSEYEGYQQIFDARHAGEYPGEAWPAYPLEQIRQLSEALLRSDLPYVMQRWAKIEAALLHEQRYSLKYVKTVCITMINALVLSFMEEGTAKPELGQLAGFLQTLQSAQDEQSLMNHISDMLKQLHGLLDQKNDAGKQHTYVQYVKKAVSEQYMHNISFSQLADELHLTRNYLSGIFKAVTGDSFSNYLSLYRIERAKELMKTQRYMIYEISEMVGYSDPAYFSRMFKNVTGISPTDYTLGK
ncbi:putative response regulatory protein [Paenibacillus konkukensis]|uniref:Response regulatory protein n=1 Tax=Paenibacillus konkukensis TaxID=2020716 RepID=A0ABY4RJB2_9BACL|nr:response regulator [Paenibacillus konkukensis]UQZ82100.1 putative response regulatory protein [Paenibacillus konkukensis]